MNENENTFRVRDEIESVVKIHLAVAHISLSAVDLGYLGTCSRHGPREKEPRYRRRTSNVAWYITRGDYNARDAFSGRCRRAKMAHAGVTSAPTDTLSNESRSPDTAHYTRPVTTWPWRIINDIEIHARVSTSTRFITHRLQHPRLIYASLISRDSSPLHATCSRAL